MNICLTYDEMIYVGFLVSEGMRSERFGEYGKKLMRSLLEKIEKAEQGMERGA